MEQAQNILDKAKIALYVKKESAFFADICLNVKHVFTDTLPSGNKLNYSATDGVAIYWNAEWVSKQTTKIITGVLFHEIGHIVLKHIYRARDTSINSEKYNRAADYVINEMAQNYGFELPEFVLRDKTFDGMSTEEVYKLLPDLPGKEGSLDIIASTNPQDEETTDALISNAALAAIARNGSIGNLPGELMFKIEQLTKPKLPWNRVLAKVTGELNKTFYSYLRPNKRYLPGIIPAKVKSDSPKVAIYVDTSSSVTIKDFSCFISETASLVSKIKPQELTFIQFDTSIKSVNTIKSLYDLERVRFVGRGGTEIVPVINRIKENKDNCSIIFTDGYFNDITPNTKKNIIWIIYDNPNFTSNVGKVIHYTMQK